MFGCNGSRLAEKRPGNRNRPGIKSKELKKLRRRLNMRREVKRLNISAGSNRPGVCDVSIYFESTNPVARPEADSCLTALRFQNSNVEEQITIIIGYFYPW